MDVASLRRWQATGSCASTSRESRASGDDVEKLVCLTMRPGKNGAEPMLGASLTLQTLGDRVTVKLVNFGSEPANTTSRSAARSSRCRSRQSESAATDSPFGAATAGRHFLASVAVTRAKSRRCLLNADQRAAVNGKGPAFCGAFFFFEVLWILARSALVPCLEH